MYFWPSSYPVSGFLLAFVATIAGACLYAAYRAMRDPGERIDEEYVPLTSASSDDESSLVSATAWSRESESDFNYFAFRRSKFTFLLDMSKRRSAKLSLKTRRRCERRRKLYQVRKWLRSFHQLPGGRADRPTYPGCP